MKSSQQGAANVDAIKAVNLEFETAAELSKEDRNRLSLSGYERNPFFRNDGKGGFDEIGSLIGIDTVLDTRSVVSADFDGDGDLDIVLRNLHNPRLLYFENVAPQQGAWIQLTLQGKESNRDAIGAIVTVVCGNWKQTQLLAAGSGFLTQQSPVLHFGLGTANKVDKVIVQWPGGDTQTFSNLATHKLHHLTETK